MRKSMFCLLFVIILAGCATASQDIETTHIPETLEPTPSLTVENTPVESTPDESTFDKSIADWCTPLEDATDAYKDSLFRNSHIIYLGSVWKEESFEDQIWKVSWSDASEVLIHENLPSPLSGFGFLSDGYHYVLGRNMSDLDDSDLQQIEDRNELSTDFVPYSPMWNMFSGSSEANDTSYGRGILHSPSGLYAMEWELENARLVLIDKKTENKTEIIKEESLADSFGGGNWSPDGKFFAFTFYRNTTPYYSQAFLVHPDAEKIVVPFSEPFEWIVLGWPRWSPDGQKVAITFTGTNGRDHVAIINRITSEVKQFQVSPYIKKDSFQYQGEMVWSPDSRFLAYISLYEHYGVEILDTENGEIFCGRNDENMVINVIDWR